MAEMLGRQAPPTHDPPHPLPPASTANSKSRSILPSHSPSPSRRHASSDSSTNDVATPSASSSSPRAQSLTVPDKEEGDSDSDSDSDNDSDSDEDYSFGGGDAESQRRHRRFVVDQEQMTSWTGQPSVLGGSETARMVLLTFSAIGITFTWGMEMTYCTPYLLSLGLSKSKTSLVWIAGPLSGLIVQPVVGVIADESTSRWGRRRPLMVLGTGIVACCLFVLGFTREIVGLFIGDEDTAAYWTLVLAILSIYAVDFAINAVMSCSRSLIVDTLPIEKQQLGAAWFSRMSAIGHMIGYAAGAVDLVGIFGSWAGDSQFKQLSIIAIFAMISTNAVTCYAVTERILISKQSNGHQGPLKLPRQIVSTIFHLPPRIKAICWAQFWSWIGWFPFLFYSTTWVGETYFRYDVPEDAKNSKDVLGDMGRIGSTSLVIYSIITFLGAFILPVLVSSPEEEKFTPRPRAIAGFLERFEKFKPNLLTTWIAGHLMFATAMAMAPFAASFRFATALVCLCGLPWTIAMWAPISFMGVEVNKLSTNGGDNSRYRAASDVSDVELSSFRGSTDEPLHLEHGSDNGSAVSTTGELSGIYFGILNIFTTLPQFVGTFISTIVFAILEPGKSPELAGDADPSEHADASGPNAIAVCLFIGAMSSFYAAHATRKLKYL